MKKPSTDWESFLNNCCSAEGQGDESTNNKKISNGK